MEKLKAESGKTEMRKAESGKTESEETPKRCVEGEATKGDGSQRAEAERPEQTE